MCTLNCGRFCGSRKGQELRVIRQGDQDRWKGSLEFQGPVRARQIAAEFPRIAPGAVACGGAQLSFQVPSRSTALV